MVFYREGVPNVDLVLRVASLEMFCTALFINAAYRVAWKLARPAQGRQRGAVDTFSPVLIERFSRILAKRCPRLEERRAFPAARSYSLHLSRKHIYVLTSTILCVAIRLLALNSGEEDFGALTFGYPDKIAPRQVPFLRLCAPLLPQRWQTPPTRT